MSDNPFEKLQNSVDSLRSEQESRERERQKEKWAAEAEDAHINRSQNFTAAMGLMRSLKKTAGEDWIAKNYFRIYLAFEGEVNEEADWHEFLRLGLAKGLANEQKAVCDAYDDLILATKSAQASFDSFLSNHMQKGSKAQSETQNKIYLMSFLVAIFAAVWLFNSDISFFFKFIASVFAFVSWLTITSSMALSIKNTNYEQVPSLEENFSALLKTSILSKHYTAANEFNNAVFSKKDYLIVSLVKDWDSNESLIFSGNLKNESKRVRDFTTQYLKNVNGFILFHSTTSNKYEQPKNTFETTSLAEQEILSKESSEASNDTKESNEIESDSSSIKSSSKIKHKSKILILIGILSVSSVFSFMFYQYKKQADLELQVALDEKKVAEQQVQETQAEKERLQQETQAEKERLQQETQAEKERLQQEKYSQEIKDVLLDLNAVDQLRENKILTESKNAKPRAKSYLVNSKFDGNNGSTDFGTEFSIQPVRTSNGKPTLSTEQYVSPKSSLYLNGFSALVLNGENLSIDLNDFTVKLYMFTNGNQNPWSYILHSNNLALSNGTSTNSGNITLGICGRSIIGPNLNDNRWHKIEFGQSDGFYFLVVDNKLQGKTPISTANRNNDRLNLNGLVIGHVSGPYSSNWDNSFIGWIDDLEISTM
jgi:hypothetical protein